MSSQPVIFLQAEEIFSDGSLLNYRNILDHLLCCCFVRFTRYWSRWCWGKFFHKSFKKKNLCFRGILSYIYYVFLRFKMSSVMNNFHIGKRSQELVNFHQKLFLFKTFFLSFGYNCVITSVVWNKKKITRQVEVFKLNFKLCKNFVSLHAHRWHHRNMHV